MKKEGGTMYAERARLTGQRARGRPVASSARGSDLTATAWIPKNELDLREWLEHGRRLGILGRGVAWWLGDWLLYGNARYGERYARAGRVTGYDVQSLMNMVYVASRFALERRRSTLSWSHHAEVTALPPELQDRWLDLAERERMSVRSLRFELQAARRVERRRAHDAAQLTRAGDISSNLVCPRCRSVIDIATNR